ncbi:X antigen family member 3-like [Eptesicus fuscus]|uniref:X antigen family member 3-like n=1 Tax=Eptesicus fuscus TaxID=29078 RepID=UPI002403E250|nr:X antigen family member 3-like [Eptesicus fuscus]
MSQHLTSRAEWNTILVEDKESDQPVGPVVDQQPSDEKPKQEGSPTENLDVTPDEEKADAGAPEVQGIDLEADTQELVKPVTKGECGNNPEVIGQACAKPEPTEMPEAEGKPPV